MKHFGHWPNFLKVACILCFYMRGSKFSFLCSIGSGFRDPGWFLQMPYLSMKHSAIGQSFRSCTYTLFLSYAVEIKIFSPLYGQHFPRFSNYNIWAWNTYIPCFYPPGGGVKIELIFALHSRDTGRFYCHIWAWNLVTDKTSWSCIYTIFLPHGVEIWACFHSTGSSFRDTSQF